ncbi:MAG: hypothetical protein JO323_18650 [Acidobacteriia bacterium]|nr:hypothetical protein [Terriglobia bacterium]
MSRKNMVRAALLAVCVASAALAQGDNAAVNLAAHPGWVQIPGALVPPECVHQIPKGARVVVNGDTITGDVTLNGVSVGHYNPCSQAGIITRPRNGRAPKLPAGNGWVESVQEQVPLGSGDNVDYVYGNWTVPTNPPANGGLIYLFNGTEPSNGQWILQPVLQYGSNGLFGGNYWVIASWLVGSNGYYFVSPAENVSPGDTIYGYTWITGVSGGTVYWEVYAYDATNGAGSWITAWTSGLQWNWAYAGVLEAYNITSCSEFPGSDYTIFRDSAAYHGYPSYDPYANWSGQVWGYGGPSCGFYAAPFGSYAYLFY